MRFRDLFRRRASSSVAKDRLKIVLVSDRANCSPNMIENIKDDIVSILSKYIEVDLESIDVKVVQTKADSSHSVPALIASIPFKEMNKVHS